MGNVPYYINIEYLCFTLSQITGLSSDIVTSTVLENFSKIYTQGEEFDLPKAYEFIEKALAKPKVKPKNLALGAR